MIYFREQARLKRVGETDRVKTILAWSLHYLNIAHILFKNKPEKCGIKKCDQPARRKPWEEQCRFIMIQRVSGNFWM